MKKIGIVGVTAEGAALCYRTIVSESHKRFDNYQHPEIAMHTFAFQDILDSTLKRDWKTVGDILLRSIEKVALAGAEFAIIPANVVHYAIEDVLQKSPIPVLNMVDLVVQECVDKGYKKPLILGVGLTMSDGLYDATLAKAGIVAIVPDGVQQETISEIIYSEIVPDNIQEESIEMILGIIGYWKSHDCDAVILACTELPIIINNQNSFLPVVDTTRLLGIRALDKALL